MGGGSGEAAPTGTRWYLEFPATPDRAPRRVSPKIGDRAERTRHGVRHGVHAEPISGKCSRALIAAG